MSPHRTHTHRTRRAASMRVARASRTHTHLPLALSLSLSQSAHKLLERDEAVRARGLLKIPPKRTVSESGRAKTLPTDLRSKVEIFPSFVNFFLSVNQCFSTTRFAQLRLPNSGDRDASRPSQARAETSNLHRFLTELTHAGDRRATVRLPRVEI